MNDTAELLAMAAMDENKRLLAEVDRLREACRGILRAAWPDGESACSTLMGGDGLMHYNALARGVRHDACPVCAVASALGRTPAPAAGVPLNCPYQYCTCESPGDNGMGRCPNCWLPASAPPVGRTREGEP